MNPFSTHGSLWDRALATIAHQVNDDVLKTYFRPIRCLEETPELVKLALPNKFLRDWVEDSYQSFIEEVLRDVTGLETEVEMSVDVAVLRLPSDAEKAPAKVQLAPPLRSRAPGRLNEKYTFENFVCGSSNQFAHAACQAVAERPGLNYNPLFIFGHTGNGKTHLLHAIGSAIKRRNPDWNIIPVSAENFTNEVIQAIRGGRMHELRSSYRDQCDVLLIDDIQFLAGKEYTQEEFFHTFNALHETQRQIVVTGDKYPNEIPKLEERLASRFQSGLVADIQPPELETRVAILEKKAHLEGINLPDDVSMFLAAHVKKNVRELEGALVRIEAFASIMRQEITVELARQALKDVLVPDGRPVDCERIVRAVADYYSIKVSDLSSQRRHKAVVLPRQVAMYLVRELTPLSFPDIGGRFGGRDHSTVMSAYKKVTAALASEGDVHQAVETLRGVLTA